MMRLTLILAALSVTALPSNSKSQEAVGRDLDLGGGALTNVGSVDGDLVVTGQLHARGDAEFGNVAVGGNVALAGTTLDLGGGVLTGVGRVDGDLRLAGGGLDVGGGTLSGVGRVEGAVVFAEPVELAGGASVKGVVVEPRDHVSHRVQGATVDLDTERIRILCGDADGCKVRLATHDWAPNRAAASREFLLYYLTNGRRWRTSHDAEGRIGDGALQHAYDLFGTCYLTDGRYDNYAFRGEDGRGFRLLLWNGLGGANRSCELTFID